MAILEKQFKSKTDVLIYLENNNIINSNSKILDVGGGKNPFEKHSSFCVFRPELFDLDLMNDAAKLIMSYEDFFPFCKTKVEVFTFKCSVTRSEWIQKSEKNLEYHISANRFLRGMVRLIVGM